jgi:Myb-like DNA-binding domain
MLSMVGHHGQTAPTTTTTTTTTAAAAAAAAAATTTTTRGSIEEPRAGSKKSGPQTTPLGGAFGWTKEEDMRLTDIMKKYKNPTNWEPIAKQLGRNRTYVFT